MHACLAVEPFECRPKLVVMTRTDPSQAIEAKGQEGIAQSPTPRTTGPSNRSFVHYHTTTALHRRTEKGQRKKHYFIVLIYKSSFIA